MKRIIIIAAVLAMAFMATGCLGGKTAPVSRADQRVAKLNDAAQNRQWCQPSGSGAMSLSEDAGCQYDNFGYAWKDPHEYAQQIYGQGMIGDISFRRAQVNTIIGPVDNVVSDITPRKMTDEERTCMTALMQSYVTPGMTRADMEAKNVRLVRYRDDDTYAYTPLFRTAIGLDERLDADHMKAATATLAMRYHLIFVGDIVASVQVDLGGLYVVKTGLDSGMTDESHVFYPASGTQMDMALTKDDIKTLLAQGKITAKDAAGLYKAMQGSRKNMAARVAASDMTVMENVDREIGKALDGLSSRSLSYYPPSEGDSIIDSWKGDAVTAKGFRKLPGLKYTPEYKANPAVLLDRLDIGVVSPLVGLAKVKYGLVKTTYGQERADDFARAFVYMFQYGNSLKQLRKMLSDPAWS